LQKIPVKHDFHPRLGILGKANNARMLG